jgi:CHAT domain-containing protein
MKDFYVEEHEEFASVETALSPFITARRRSNLPISLHPWKPSNSSTSPRHTAPTRAPVSFIQGNDPALALEEDIQQTCERFSPRSFAIHSLHQRAQFLLLSFMRSRRAKDLENSIEIARNLLDMRPRQLRRVKLLRMLAFCYALGSHEPGHMNKSVAMFEDAFQDESATTSERLIIAWWWATFAREWDHPSTTLAYQNTLSALQCALTGAFAVQWQASTIGRLGSKIHIPLDYASYQIEKGQLELAVETIEQGKTMIWSDIYGLRTSAGRLRAVDPDLADRLATVSQDLTAVNASILAHRAVGSRLDEEEDHEHMDTFSPMFKEQRRLLRERQEIVAGIKALPGFENFMEAVRFQTLQNAASCGPIIIINHCRWRCDILIVLHNKPPFLIPTTEGFYERASTLASTLLDARKKYAVESELYQQELRSILKELYERVGQPVLNKLQELGTEEQSRIWWYPTSVFCSLPLHAMGPVPSTDGRERYFSDIYICSYTPTLGSLIAARTPTAPTSDRGPTLLFVGRPNESPRGTRDMKVIRSIGVPATRLVFGNATREAVINGLQKHRLAHFACRSYREEGKPFDTALELDGGDRLALLDIVRGRVPTTELAVLSSGRTAELVDGTDFVEGLHLAAAMQYYGFGSVVGTMWDLGDVGGEDLSLGFYKETLSGGAAEDGTPPSERSARALRHMVQKLRETRVTLQRWANWVHYGA